ncbi:MAG: DUF11 domain-containing protein [Chloroflexi bacterium]|nr:DUF11 domain-containing protein [Chloroflexota bacterium]
MKDSSRHLRVMLLLGICLALIPWITQAAPGNAPQVIPATAPEVAPENPGPATLAKIDPQVLKEFTTQKSVTYLVYMKNQADLTQVNMMPMGLARHQQTFNTLFQFAERSQQGLRSLIAERVSKGEVQQQIYLWIINGAGITSDEATLYAIAARPDVARITANNTHKLPDLKKESSLTLGQAGAAPATVGWNIHQIRADQVWQDYGIRGQGVVVASMDTGVDYTHPAVANQYRGYNGNNNYNWADFTHTYPNNPGDGNGHGTHTMGTMVGDDGGENKIGVAPGAKWIAVKIFDDSGSTTDLAIHQGFQWILAPTDLTGNNPDPSKAPQVVNNSWGSFNGGDPSFQTDVQAWRAAGIFPAFAAGNEGDGAGTVGTPGGYPESFAVGATDADSRVADFSSRGPSFFVQTKPEVSAPGRFVRSSIPGATYVEASGTSMATPHIAGTIALMLSANPALSLNDLATYLEQTAHDLGPTGPDNDYGWGLIDAYDAVRWARGSGKLFGQVQDSKLGQPIPGATIIGVQSVPPSTGGAAEDKFEDMSDTKGGYAVSVPGGLYTVQAGAFGYITGTFTAVEVLTGYQSLRDFVLKEAPKGKVSGQLTEVFTNSPVVSATVTVCTGKEPPIPLSAAASCPVQTRTDQNGNYHLDLPAGSYILVIRSARHRTARENVIVAASGQVQRSIALRPAPQVLLIDGDNWQGFDISTYYRRGLEVAGLPYVLWHISDQNNIPDLNDLENYDVVIWTDPVGSPGYLDEVRGDNATINMLSDYLNNGGRLLLAGQDIAYWDANSNNPPFNQALAPDFFRDFLHVSYVRDAITSKLISGTPGDIWEGLNLELESLYGLKYGQSLSPDEVRPTDNAAIPFARFDNGTLAGLKIEGSGTNAAYRAIYLPFAVESSGSISQLGLALDRAVGWLASTSLTKTVDRSQADPGDILTYHLSIHNDSRSVVNDVHLVDAVPTATTYITGSATGGLIYNPAQNRVEWTGSVAARSQQAVTFQVRLSSQLSSGVVVTNTAMLTDALGANVERSATTRIAASPLSTSKFTADPAIVTPGTRVQFTLALYNSNGVAVTATFSNTIPSQFTYVDGSVSVDGTPSGAVYDAATHRISWSGVIPAASGDTPGSVTIRYLATLSSNVSAGQQISNDAVISDGKRPRFTVSALVTVARADLSGSTKSVTPRVVTGGDVVTYTISLSNTGTITATGVAVTDTLPAAMQYVPGSATGGLTYITATRTLLWTGDVPVSKPALNDYGAVFNADVSGPKYQWIDISSTGTAISPLGDDTSHGPYPLGFTFNFYGKNYSNFYVSDNGFVSFFPITATYSTNLQLPSPSAPRTLLAPFWSDLNPGASGQIFYQTLDNQRLVVSYVGVQRFGGTATSYTFQVIINSNGLIYYQYGPLTGSITQGTVGLQNENGTRGLTILYSGVGRLIAEGTAIRLDPPRPATPPVILTFRATANNGQTPGTMITNSADIRDANGTIRRSAAIYYDSPDLSSSTKQASRSIVAPSSLLTYTITVRNTGSAAESSARVVDTLPPLVSYVPGSATNGATYDSSTGTIRWTGPVAKGGAASFNFTTQVTPTITGKVDIINQARIQDSIGTVVTATATVRTESPDLTNSFKEVNPTGLGNRHAAASGEVLTYTITLANQATTADPAVHLVDSLPPGLTYVPGSASGGATYNPTQRRIEWQGAVPAAGGDITATANTQPGGPIFFWIDIGQTGINVPNLDDDQAHGPYPLGFDFPYFGQTYHQFFVHDNGFITLVPVGSGFASNGSLPDTNSPRAMIAPFWDDLLPSKDQGRIVYQQIDDNTTVISYLNVAHFGTGGPYTFQIVLRSDGTMSLQYLTMDAPLNTATIGLQDGTGTQGLLLAFNQPTVRNGLAVHLGPPAGKQIISYQARVDAGIPFDSVLTNTVQITSSTGQAITRQASVEVNTLNFTNSAIRLLSTPTPGGIITAEITLRNNGTATAPNVIVTVPTPAHTRILADRLGSGWTYDPVQNVARFQGSVGTGQEKVLTLPLEISRPLPDGTQITVVASIADGVHTALTLSSTIAVRAANLAGSTKRASTTIATSGAIVTYIISVINQGNSGASTTISDTLPDGVELVSDSLFAGNGTIAYDSSQRIIRWAGAVPPRSIATISYRVHILSGTVIVNTAEIDDNQGTITRASATVLIGGHQIFLPLVTTQH